MSSSSPLLLISLLVCLLSCCASASSSPSSSSSTPSSTLTEALEQVATPTQLGLLGDAPYPCSWTAPDGTNFDFSGLTTATGTVVKGDQSDVYNINVCGIGNGDPPSGGSGGNCLQNSATVCFQFTWSPTWFALAEYTALPASSPPTYSLIGQDSAMGVQMTFSNGVYANNKVTLVMQFICSAGLVTPIYTAAHQSQYNWMVTVTSEQCCPVAKKSSSGLSGGWAFIIFLLCLTVVYVVGGCAYKHYRKGTQGMESCPNVDFWRELPGLVKDGCVFFALKCRDGVNRCRGQSTASSSDYSNFK